MACDCDGLNNQLRNLNDRIRRLEDANRRSSNGGGGNNQDDLIERVFNHKKWRLMEKVLTMIYAGNRA
jgi:hypothetical protein